MVKSDPKLIFNQIVFISMVGSKSAIHSACDSLFWSDKDIINNDLLEKLELSVYKM